MPIIIPPTRAESVCRALAYFLLGCAGVWVLASPPTTIQGQLGWLTAVWGACLITAFVASVAAFKRRYRVEYMALPLTVTGVLIYACTLWMLVPDTLTRAPQALIVTAMATALLARLVSLHRLVTAWKEGPWIGSEL